MYSEKKNYLFIRVIAILVPFHSIASSQFTIQLRYRNEDIAVNTTGSRMVKPDMTNSSALSMLNQSEYTLCFANILHLFVRMSNILREVYTVQQTRDLSLPQLTMMALIAFLWFSIALIHSRS